MTPRFISALVSISLALMLASCSPMVDVRGHSAEALDTSQIVTGQTTAEDVVVLLGSPTSTSSFGDETWYYITQTKERVGMFAPEVTAQQVLAIAFDDSRVVSGMSTYRREDGKPVEMVSKTTPTEGHNLTFIEQMLGNLGRFNSPSRGVDPRRTVGR